MKQRTPHTPGILQTFLLSKILKHFDCSRKRVVKQVNKTGYGLVPLPVTSRHRSACVFSSDGGLSGSDPGKADPSIAGSA